MPRSWDRGKREKEDSEELVEIKATMEDGEPLHYSVFKGGRSRFHSDT